MAGLWWHVATVFGAWYFWCLQIAACRTMTVLTFNVCRSQPPPTPPSSHPFSCGDCALLIVPY